MNLREARVRKGWSQEDLAERLGVTKQAVSLWEKGVHTPRKLHREELYFLLDLDEPRTE